MKEVKEKKKKKPLGLPQIVFQVCNTILVVAILSLYAYRFFYYKKYFEDKYKPEAGKRLSEVVIDSLNIADENGVKANEDGTYTYVGKSENNYVVYSGNLYRIIGVDSNGNTTCISNDSLYLCRNNQNVDFIDSELYATLRDDYYNKLDKANYYLNYNVNYHDVVDDISNMDTSYVDNDVIIRLLTLQEYQKAKAANSYLNNGEEYWLQNRNSEGAHYFITKDGQVSITDNKSYLLPVRVVITIKGGVEYVSGSGTKESPYIAFEYKYKTMKDSFIGQYVKIDDYTFKVSDKTDEGVYLTCTNPLSEKHNFKDKDKDSFNYESGVGKYLMEEFLDKIENYQDILQETEFKFRKFNDVDINNYEVISVTGYVGLPAFDGYGLFNGQYLLMDISTDNTLEVVVKDNVIYMDLIKEKYDVYPVVCISNDCDIIQGVGSLEDPLVLR